MVPTVLVVDDDPTFLALAGRMLEWLGVERVVTAATAADALIRAELDRPAAALVDVGLPDRDGIDLGAALATLPWSPRVVLTSTDRDAGRAIPVRQGDGALPFIPKDELDGDSLQRVLLRP